MQIIENYLAKRSATVDATSVPSGMTRVTFHDDYTDVHTMRYDDRDCALLAAARWIVDGVTDE